ncbi:MAG: hypothetical protein ABL867_11335, partial [Rickettsiales bacterium]
MTTEITLKRLVREGKLKQFEPDLLPDESHEREIFMTTVLFKYIDETVLKKHGLEYQVIVEQHLTSFARGDKIRSGTHIKEVMPFGNGVWAFRILEDPQTRIFGGFIEKDRFVAFCMVRKSNLVGNSYNHNYSYYLNKVKREWKILLNNKAILLSSNIN